MLISVISRVKHILNKYRGNFRLVHGVDYLPPAVVVKILEPFVKISTLCLAPVVKRYPAAVYHPGGRHIRFYNLIRYAYCFLCIAVVVLKVYFKLKFSCYTAEVGIYSVRFKPFFKVVFSEQRLTACGNRVNFRRAGVCRCYFQFRRHLIRNSCRRNRRTVIFLHFSLSVSILKVHLHRPPFFDRWFRIAQASG